MQNDKRFHIILNDGRGQLFYDVRCKWAGSFKGFLTEWEERGFWIFPKVFHNDTMIGSVAVPWHAILSIEQREEN